ncbi:MAG: hypothetical protein KAW56_04715 [Candidatus Marinimicrobia bacterium]|nr:hypothetical protein [Candidatus Neomarinimicrobiota bacterium]
MCVKSDYWIEEMSLKHRMIEPFEKGQINKGVISYGLSAYGYDMRIADKFKILTVKLTIFMYKLHLEIRIVFFLYPGN